MLKERRSLIGSGILLLAAIIWGFAFSAQDAAGEALTPFAVNSLRFYIGFLTLLPIIFVADKLRGNGRHLFSRKNRYFIGISRRELLFGVVCGLVLCVAASFQQLGLQEAGTGTGNAAFITALYIVIVSILSLFLRKRPGARVWAGVLLAVGGFYVMTAEFDMQGSGVLAFFKALPTAGFHPVRGDLYVLACAFVFAIHILVIDHANGAVDGFRLSMLQFLVAAIVLTPVMLTESFTIADVQIAMPSLLFLGVLSCGVAYTAQIIGQKYTQPTVASMILSLESVFGMLGSILFRHETITVFEAIGCVLVFAAIILSQLPDRKKKNTCEG